MIRILLLAVLLAGCNKSNNSGTAADSTAVPIGPGTDTSVTVPPDTPMSHESHGTSAATITSQDSAHR